MSIVLDWDNWRANYGIWSFAKQLAFYKEVFKDYPCQDHTNKQVILEFFATLDAPFTVCEIGGWTGYTAAYVLAHCAKIVSWTNYEICHEAASKSETQDVRYQGVGIDNWPWELSLKPAGVLVATHVIEHMKSHEVEKLLKRNRWQYCLVECPLDDEASSWQGYHGTHIIDVGWVGLQDLFARHGYTCRLIGKTRVFTHDLSTI